MLNTPLTITLAVALACLLTGIAKSGLGGILCFAITPLLSLVMPLGTAVGLMLPILLLGDIFTVGTFWGKWEARHVWILLAGGVVGLSLGTFVLTSVDALLLRRALGMLILAFTTYKIFEAPILARLPYTLRPWHGVLAGAGSGFTSALAHAGAPPVTIYLLMQRLPPVVFVATVTQFFFVLDVLKAPYYYYAGLFDYGLILRLAWLAPLVPLGVWIGKWLVVRLDRQRFEQVIVGLLCASGIVLLLSG